MTELKLEAEAISQDRRVPEGQREFVADNARIFTAPLPGRDHPPGNPGGSAATGPLGADTELVAGWQEPPPTVQSTLAISRLPHYVTR